MRLVLVTAALAAITAGSASAATLTHAYDFSSSYASGGSAYVADHVGGADGLLLNGAAVSGGALSLDGTDDYVQFGEKIVDTSGPFSVLLRVEVLSNLSGITEMISQGYSGGPGFYIGENGGGGFRLGDATGGTSYGVPGAGAFHNLFLTYDAGIVTFSIDGGAATTSGSGGFTTGGTNTRLGRQFEPYNEFFHGRYDEVRVFDGVATYAEATAPLRDPGAVPEPQSWAMMILGFFGMGALLRRRGTDGWLMAQVS